MDSNHLEDSKSSSEETDRSDQDDVGTGRSYECVFCKRGFTTAQALGGHMNIHRKDRAKNSRPIVSSSSNNNNKVDDDDENYGSKSYSYPPTQNYQPHYSLAPDQVHVSYQAYFPATAWGFSPPPSHTTQYHNHELFSQHDVNRFGNEDWTRSLSLRIGPSHTDDHENNKINHGSNHEDDLDLELRLGHDP